MADKLQCPNCFSMRFQGRLKEVSVDENFQRAIVLEWICEHCKCHVMDVEDDKKMKQKKM